MTIRGELGDGRLLIDVADAAGRLGVSERLLREEIRRGRLPHRRFGCRVKLLVPDDLEEYLRRCGSDPAA